MLLTTLSVISVALTASQPNEAARQEFTRAWASVPVRLSVPVSLSSEHDSALLRSYVLYPYLQAARLQARLQSILPQGDQRSLDGEIAEFLTQQGRAPATREVRRSWLLALAQRNEWPTFLQFFVLDGADAELKCHWLAAQLAVTEKIDPAAIKPIWLSDARLPSACNAPFEWAKQQQIINNDWTEMRVRQVLKAGNFELARDLIASLPAGQTESFRQWAQLIEKPQAALDTLIAQPGVSVEPQALLDGWQRLARRDVDAAMARLPRLIAARNLNAASVSRLNLEVALSLSWSRRPEALSYFSRVLSTDMTEQAHEWLVRAALWARDWQRARQGIDAMPESLRAQVRWRYWLARTMEQTGEKNAAQVAFKALVDHEDNYYAALAAAHVETTYVPHPISLQVDATAAARVEQLSPVQRAGELFAVNMRDAADLEWQSVFATLTVAEKEAAGSLAHEWGWYDQAILSLAKVSRFDDYSMLYPRPFAAEVSDAAKVSGLAPELIYAVMRQETLFRPDAKSGANARGLLQLLPVTARQVARREQRPLPQDQDLFEPRVNVPLGAMYLKTLINQFNGQKVLGLAAYNAGPTAVRRWLPKENLPGDIWIENIPYNETRTYVQRILWHSLIFAWLQSDHPARTADWLASIRPAAVK